MSTHRDAWLSSQQGRLLACVTRVTARIYQQVLSERPVAGGRRLELTFRMSGDPIPAILLLPGRLPAPAALLLHGLAS